MTLLKSSLPAMALGVVLGAVAVLSSNATLASDEADGPTYVGSKACKKCHIKQYKSWEKTKMGQTFDGLQANERTDKKAEAKLDPTKDYTTDENCLKCHTVGFGTESGYKVPPPDDKKAQRRAKKLAGVGCESCHGPGSEYNKIFKEIQKSERKYKVEELYAAGMTKIGPDVCAKCHNNESPFVGEDYVFDYDKLKDQDTHEHLPLKYRDD